MHATLTDAEPRIGWAPGSVFPGALHTSGGRKFRARSPPARAGSHRPSVCGVPVAATAAAKGKTAAVGVAATTTAGPGARRGLMLSSLLSPPLWASRASASLHSRAPSPPPVPALRSAGSGHTPSRHVTGRGGGSPQASPVRPAVTAPKWLTAPRSARLIATEEPPHTRERPREASPPPPAHVGDVLRRGLPDRSYRLLPNLRRLHGVVTTSHG
ncbi:translation initiation factor IF-2-like [Sturnira hondurensis]|uniref:translation initiation factor IF-2-like n=1 Tax=Sturnira hondurensis TaxID=192404 RepID=UPI00187A70F5|nr:translation initiation factor IF-2-like [Sturnira hondurensis]